jgi:hypothetical protein
MSSNSDSSDSALPRARHSLLMRLVIAVAILFGVTLATALIATGGVVWWMRARNLAARRWLEDEVDRIQAAGEPITTDDCYAFQAAKEPGLDVTSYWLAALETIDERQLSQEGKLLPIIGTAPDEALKPDSPGSRIAEVRELLKKYDGTFQAIFEAARQSGHCSFPVQFEDGLKARLDHVNALRNVARLVKLQLRVRAGDGDIQGAMQSLSALVAAADAVNNEPVLVEYLVSLALSGYALGESLFLLNECSLSDDQLLQMQSLLSRLDARAGLTPAIYGERAQGYYAFHHPGLILDIPALVKFDGQLMQPVDCQTYLEWSRDLIDYSREDFPLALDHAEQFDARVQTLMKQPIERFWHVTTLLLFPAVPTVFKACGKSMAYQEITLAAIAAERHRLKNGSFPRSIEELTPEFLPEVPLDPFDGKAIRLLHRDDQLVIYSVGVNRVDDGGTQAPQKTEPDIVATVKTRKSGPSGTEVPGNNRAPSGRKIN